MTRLTPNFGRVVLRVGGMVLIVCAFGYYQQGFFQGKWWTAGYILSLAIPIVTMPLAAWFMFVPRLMEYSEDEITITTLLGKGTYSWSELYAYGPGNNVFKMQFSGDTQPFQIYAGAYPDDQWSKLRGFLKSKYPQCEAKGFSIGPWMRPKGK
jgi:hypothetical protein